MLDAPHNLDRFIRAVHRRWVAVRAAESAGIGVLIGCALAALLLPVLMWRGEPALPVVLTAAAVAAGAGLIAGILRRPNLIASAAEADRQLNLHDLLSSALLTRSRAANDPWAAMVVASADERCRTLTPGAVILHRLGGRAWGGIGLAAALVLTLALMGANPPAATSATAFSPPSAAATGLRPPGSMQASTGTSGRDPSNRQRRPDDAREADADVRSSDPALGGSMASDASRNSSGDDGSGGGLAISRETSMAQFPPRSTRAGEPSAAEESGSKSGGGAAMPIPTSADDDPALSSAHSSQHSTGDAPAWESTGWPAARDQALSAVRDGHIPDTYRDLVREYFRPTGH